MNNIVVEQNITISTIIAEIRYNITKFIKNHTKSLRNIMSISLLGGIVVSNVVIPTINSDCSSILNVSHSLYTNFLSMCGNMGQQIYSNKILFGFFLIGVFFSSKKIIKSKNKLKVLGIEAAKTLFNALTIIYLPSLLLIVSNLLLSFLNNLQNKII